LAFGAAIWPDAASVSGYGPSVSLYAAAVSSSGSAVFKYGETVSASACSVLEYDVGVFMSGAHGSPLATRCGDDANAGLATFCHVANKISYVISFDQLHQ